MPCLPATARVARRLVAAALATAAVALPLAAQTAGGTGKPTLALLDFTNSALAHHADYEPLSSGIAEMLITQLSGNPSVRVVERAKLHKAVEEQNLGASGRVDKETMAKLGRILGAQHFMTGSFMVDGRGTMRLDVRSFNTETSLIEYTQSVTGKAEDVLALVDQMAEKINAGLRLPSLPAGVRAVSAAPPRPKDGAAKADQLRATLALGRGLKAHDAGNDAAAVVAYREAVQAYPSFERAKVLLASAEQPRGANKNNE